MLLTTALACLMGRSARAQVRGPSAAAQTPNLVGHLQRPLRYSPEAGDFVIENGQEFFNRPLYGGHSGFRVDGGDKPEFVLYLPGRGGNIRFALRTKAGVRWLHEAENIVTRYRPGELHYEIRDPLLGQPVHLMAIAAMNFEGLLLKINSTAPAELIWVFGGVNGVRGARDGDIGTERVPISEYFQFKPEFAEGNKVEISPDGLKLKASAATIAGVASGTTRWTRADAANWNDLTALLGPVQSGTDRSIAVARMALGATEPGFVLFQVVERPAVTILPVYSETAALVTPEVAQNAPAYSKTELPGLFDANARPVAELRSQVRIQTPDAFINAAAAAVNVASDALWDGGAILHGAIAWRARLLGWRGPYALDALGWHARSRQNFAVWTGRQNTDPASSVLPPADEQFNLARNEAGLHSNGDLSHSHYDMNLVFVDALFRHLLWTGDKDYAREVWPVIERHLAWERRLFRRKFDGLPLYEAYAAIWASDGIAYSGGGVAYASAYNLFHNRMAARVAEWLGFDPLPYRREAGLIAKAIQTHLWSHEKGALAEYKDWLGLRRVHKSFGLWSFYHAVDSSALSSRQAWRMSDAVLHGFAQIPVEGPGVPTDRTYYVYPTTNWMPYSWSTNNVVMAENLHTALAFWQCGRVDEAFALCKGALLASMFMGISPGNVGTMNYLDVYRRESQRDFADGAGALARALVEGLFGISPDAIAGELTLTPGFPADWQEAAIDHPSLAVSFARKGMADRFEIHRKDGRFSKLRLRVPLRHAQVKTVTVNGQPVSWRTIPHAGGYSLVEILSGFDMAAAIEIVWRGARSSAGSSVSKPRSSPPKEHFDWSAPLQGPFDCIDLSQHFNDRAAEIFKKGKYRAPRSPFVSLALPAQGIGSWAGQVSAFAEIDDTGLRAVSSRHGGSLILPNGVPFKTPGLGTAPNIVFTSQWDNYPREVHIGLAHRASHAFLLMAGSTNPMQSHFENGEVSIRYYDGSETRLVLENPTTWWPIEQDYFIDDYQFRFSGPLPPRVDLKTGRVRILRLDTFKGQGGPVPGGAATVLGIALDSRKPLERLSLRTLANDVVLGLMAVTLLRA